MFRSYLALLALAGAILALAGCYGETGEPDYEPGVYKGKQDPLTENRQGASSDEALIKRFKKVQTDR